ncbi:unnamed protein product [Thelazia callipaeda]|uniref:PAM2 domain-containing protein n=1 Tax=Thelazia callipaeda TaxID=103827 RepID=A0A158RC37_THECL|nr:unnamed protein product [Thelazia callipaeda]
MSSCKLVFLEAVVANDFSPEAPPSRITVVAEESEMPTTIMPPAQVEGSRYASVISSPPLPALVKRMENELTDNPFRPEESLFHEVDPIVEAYKNKPYPPSLPGSQNSTPVKTANQSYLNGLSPSFLLGSKEMDLPQGVSDTTPLNSSTPLINSMDQAGIEDSSVVDLPKARQVECVHIEKKKCGCCTLQ